MPLRQALSAPHGLQKGSVGPFRDLTVACSRDQKRRRRDLEDWKLCFVVLFFCRSLAQRTSLQEPRLELEGDALNAPSVIQPCVPGDDSGQVFEGLFTKLKTNVTHVKQL